MCSHTVYQFSLLLLLFLSFSDRLQAFSKQALEKNTIVTIDPKYQRLLGANKVGLSFRDKAIINRLYNCDRLCSNSDDVCRNNGYLKVPPKGMRNPAPGSNACTCECPPNTSGQFCEVVTNPSYYDAIEPLACGGNITQEGIIETPGYPIRSAPKQSCVWQITVRNETLDDHFNEQ